MINLNFFHIDATISRVGGSRGGADQFKWDNVKTEKYREVRIMTVRFIDDYLSATNWCTA